MAPAPASLAAPHRLWFLHRTLAAPQKCRFEAASAAGVAGTALPSYAPCACVALPLPPLLLLLLLLLLQAHMSRLAPPISDYVTDTRSALDNSVRLAQVRLSCRTPTDADSHC